MRLHPHNIAQKTEVMVEHFNAVTRHKIGGRAKAMVVTGSRLEAVRYKQSFDRYIQHKGYPIKSLVAFSGTVQDDKLADVTFTEEGMNHGIREKELPEKFATQEYQVLLVAEKYQTGFDQPLLHTMYVDKRLAGIQAVQTLSRLNRIHPLKEDTFVLDFVNDREEIREAFKTYYEGAEMGEEVDPARMYQLKGELDASGVYLAEEVERFCAVYFKPKPKQSAMDHQAMHAALDPAVSRFTVLQDEHEEEAELWRGKVQAFRNLYGFLSQVIPYQDSDLERLYVFLRHLATKLPRRRSGPAYQFDDEVRLEYYRLQKISEGSISLRDGDARPLDGPTEVGSGLVRTQPVPLSQLIDLVNERFGTDFNQADQLFFDQIVEAAMADDGLRQAAAVNPGDKFELVFKHLIENLFVERMDQNEEIFVRFMNDLPFQKVVTAWMASEAYTAAARRRGWREHCRGAQGRCHRNAAKAPDRPTAPRGALRDLCAARPPQGRGRSVQRSPARRGRQLGVGRRRLEAPPAPGHVRRPGRRQVDGARHPGRLVLPLQGARHRHAAGQDCARATARRHRSRQRRALHRQALPEREGHGWRLLASRPDHPEAYQPGLPAH